MKRKDQFPDRITTPKDDVAVESSFMSQAATLAILVDKARSHTGYKPHLLADYTSHSFYLLDPVHQEEDSSNQLGLGLQYEEVLDILQPYGTLNQRHLIEKRMEQRYYDSFGGGKGDEVFKEDITDLLCKLGGHSPKASRAILDYAWDRGHSSGLEEVMIHIDDLISLAATLTSD